LKTSTDAKLRGYMHKNNKQQSTHISRLSNTCKNNKPVITMTYACHTFTEIICN